MTALRAPRFDMTQQLLDLLANDIRTQRLITAATLQSHMIAGFGDSDASGAWSWRQAYDLCEAALLIAAEDLAAVSTSSETRLAAFEAAQARLPTQSRRGEEQLRLQQFSTPLPYAFTAAVAANIRAGETLLEPSAGVGALAKMGQLFGAKLRANEIDAPRRDLLGRVLGLVPTAHNAEHIDDLLPPSLRPSVILMNPPFVSSSTRADPAMAERHLYAAFKRLAPGGRLVAILPTSFTEASIWWAKMKDRAAWRLRLQVPGSAFRKHGTSVETLLCVFDKLAPTGGGAEFTHRADSLAEALQVLDMLPARASHTALAPSLASPLAGLTRAAVAPRPQALVPQPLVYRPRAQAQFGEPVSPVFAAYVPQRVDIPGAQPHPTDLVESLAMASVLPPVPTYQPLLPSRLVEKGLLSVAQLETVIHAGEAHSLYLPGLWARDGSETAFIEAVSDGVKVRQGFFLGDGTGAGKGRQGAAIILDNFLQGRRLAVWISKSALLIEDARRDWAALGGNPFDIHDVGTWTMDADVPVTSGILFVTYATLRAEGKRGRTRLAQLIAALGTEFDGVVLLDESHALSNALSVEDEEFGLQEGSLQGITGLRLQCALPLARIVYVSATGASKLEALVYAQRLGLWGNRETPFPNLESFLDAMNAGGVAAMEVVARDLKALGLYGARALSMVGVEYDVLHHDLSDRQRQIYDTYATAFQVIHANVTAALQATGVLNPDGQTAGKRARGAAMSRFESVKQRFFLHLITGLAAPTVLQRIEADLAAGEAVVLQLVSTGEAMLNRRIDPGFTGPLDDDSLDLTPREFLLDYLHGAFPTELHEEVEVPGGGTMLVPVRDAEGNLVHSREAEALRDAMILRCGALEPVPTILDQILWHFGADAVAEVSGRQRRPVYKRDGGESQLLIEKRSARANLAETDAFMADRKRILAFSQAGGTGRSYHAEQGAKNSRRRNHYIIEPGWQANEAVQGAGRSHRSGQVCPPRYRVLAVGVPSHKRFSSTIARRLEEMGALTKGQRQTGGSGLFRAEDNLESPYALAALKSWFAALIDGRVESITLDNFERLSGLTLVSKDGKPLDQMPPMPRFLNRLLAFALADQERIYDELDAYIAAKIEDAKERGTYDRGVEQLTGENIQVVDDYLLTTHARTGAETRLYRISRDVPVYRASGDRALFEHEKAVPVEHRETGEPALLQPCAGRFRSDGAIIPMVRLTSPAGQRKMSAAEAALDYQRIDAARFAAGWNAAVALLPTHKSEELYVLAGLLLPIWRQVSFADHRVFRVEASNHPALLGRVLSPTAAQVLIGRIKPAETVTAAGVRAALIAEGRTLQLASGLQLRVRRVAGEKRIEVEGPIEPVLAELKAAGCFVEIIQYRARVFVPWSEGENGLKGLEALLGRFPVEG